MPAPSYWQLGAGILVLSASYWLNLSLYSSEFINPLTIMR